jgi:starch phosphorylase
MKAKSENGKSYEYKGRHGNCGGAWRCNTPLKQYGCGPIPLMRTDGFYKRHLLFDNMKGLLEIGSRERCEAFARSLRDVLSQRRILTEEKFQRESPKRVYYLSMEFLLVRSSANKMNNLPLEPFVVQAAKQKNFDLVSLLQEESDAGLGNGGLGRELNLRSLEKLFCRNN